MNIYIENIREVDCVCEALILPFTEGDSGLYAGLDSTTLKLIKKSFLKEFHGKQNEVLLIPAPENIKPERILLVGLGISGKRITRRLMLSWYFQKFQKNLRMLFSGLRQ
jgi:hypothetical protein